MKKSWRLFALLVAVSSPVFAADVKVNWGKLDEFTDIQESFAHREQFRLDMQKEFALVFQHHAKKLPEGYQLEITVTDLDLAGDVRPGVYNGVHHVRVMKELYWPRMNIEFELKNAQGEVVAKGNENLRDMDYLRRVRIPSGNTEFEFEEKMIQDWFKKQYATGAFPSTQGASVATR